MRLLQASRQVAIPDDVTVEVKGRRVRVKGPRGTLSKDMRHAGLDMFLITNEEGAKIFKVDCHMGKKKKLASIRTTISHVTNMITGVTKGFEYKMRLVYAHFPININIVENGAKVEIRNFLGEKRVRVIKMLPGVTIARSDAVKDELILTGNDVELVSRSTSLIHQICLVRNKDIRKFLDGIYLSGKGTVVKDE
ncbi:60S ribosomal protein L9 [Picochlorum sp. SENEW3]|nr:60S ribosomal protein L9 [Picochlorum sp. SENEW3]